MLLRGKNALVIGGSGALGPSLIEELIGLGCTVTWTSRAAETPRSQHLKLDLLNRVEIVSVLESRDFDLIFNLAADLGTNLDSSLNVNVLGLNNLLSVCLDKGDKARIVLIGSAAEYGHIDPLDNPVSEDHALSPVSVYGLTKVWQTQLALHYSDRLQIVVARMFNLDAPNLKESLFLGKLDKQIAEFKEGLLSEIQTGPLDAVRDYIDVQMAATQICAIGALGEAGQAYHVASGSPISMYELLCKRFEQANLDLKYHRTSASQGSTRSSGVSKIYADITRTSALVCELYGSK